MNKISISLLISVIFLIINISPFVLAELDPSLNISKLNYLGNSRTFSVGFDDMYYGTEDTTNYSIKYDGLKDFMNLYDLTKKTKYSWGLIPVPLIRNKTILSNLSDPNYNFRWIMADSEYDKRITLCLHGYTHNNTLEDWSDSASSNMSIQNAINIYKEVIGRNATCWKFPGHIEGTYGRNSLLNLSYIYLMDNKIPQHQIKGINSIKYGSNIMGTTLPSSFTNNFFVSGHFASNQSSYTSDNINKTSYFNKILNLINYAEAQNDISYEDWSDLGEIYDMYNYTNLTINNLTSFNINTNNTYWTYRKRLAINITGNLDDATHSYIQIITPSGMKVSQNMTTYTGTGANRAALVIIPVEDGNYTVINMSTQPTDPSFSVQNVTIYANNTKWNWNGTKLENASAYMTFKIIWTGASNVWGDYNNTDTTFNFTHGFQFNQSQGDNWWVEHDMKSGKLHILGASGPGTEYITAQLPFTFVKSIDTATNKQYILNATGVFKNITGSFNLSIPESYDSNYNLSIFYKNGSFFNSNFYKNGNFIIFPLELIEEDASLIIIYHPIYYGDANCDGIINDYDINITKQLIVGINVYNQCCIKKCDNLNIPLIPFLNKTRDKFISPTDLLQQKKIMVNSRIKEPYLIIE